MSFESAEEEKHEILPFWWFWNACIGNYRGESVLVLAASMVHYRLAKTRVRHIMPGHRFMLCILVVYMYVCLHIHYHHDYISMYIFSNIHFRNYTTEIISSSVNEKLAQKCFKMVLYFFTLKQILIK